MKLKPSEIKIGKRIRQEMGDLDSLYQSMIEGLVNPVSLDANHKLLDGYRRLTAWQKHRKDEPIEVVIVEIDPDDPLQEIRAQVATDKMSLRLDPEELHEGSKELRAIVETKALEKKAEAGRKYGESHPRELSNDSLLSSPTKQNNGNRTEFIVAKQLGIGIESYRRMTRIYAQDSKGSYKIRKELGPSLFDTIKKTAKKKGINAAYKKYLKETEKKREEVARIKRIQDSMPEEDKGKEELEALRLLVEEAEKSINVAASKVGIVIEKANGIDEHLKIRGLYSASLVIAIKTLRIQLKKLSGYLQFNLIEEKTE